VRERPSHARVGEEGASLVPPHPAVVVLAALDAVVARDRPRVGLVGLLDRAPDGRLNARHEIELAFFPELGGDGLVFDEAHDDLVEVDGLAQ